jgi:hypothetical protein
MPENTPDNYKWVKYAALPLLASLYPFLLPFLESAYGIEQTKKDAVKSEIQDVIKSEETIESLSQKIEEHNKNYLQVIQNLNQQIDEFAESRRQWNQSKAVTLRVYNNGEIKYSSIDGKEYVAYYDRASKSWKYVKNGKIYTIFSNEE